MIESRRRASFFMHVRVVTNHHRESSFSFGDHSISTFARLCVIPAQLCLSRAFTPPSRFPDKCCWMLACRLPSSTNRGLYAGNLPLSYSAASTTPPHLLPTFRAACH